MSDKKEKPVDNKPKEDELWDADPKCDHDIIAKESGGVVCTKCGGWSCY